MNDPRMSDGTKLGYHKDRVLAHLDRGERVAPIHLDIGIAKFCNIACYFCYGKFQNLKKVFIQKEPLLQTIRDAAAIGVKSIAFIGDGEPTCNPYLYDALCVAREETGLNMAISTNGVLVDSVPKCHEILKTCTWMRFCLSAGTRQGYIKVHGKDYFSRVTDNIERLMRIKLENNYKCDVGLQAVFDPSSMKEEMIAEAKLAVDLGVNYFVIKQCSLPDEGQSGMATFDLKLYDKKETLEALKICENLSSPQTRIIVKWNTMAQKGVRPYVACPSVPFISELSGNGDWYPCGYFFGDKESSLPYRFGNVHEKSLKEIFESERYWNIIKTMRENFNCHTQCKGACRLDNTNKLCHDVLQGTYQWPEQNPNGIMGINFI